MQTLSDQICQDFSGNRWLMGASPEAHKRLVAAGAHPHDTGWAEKIMLRLKAHGHDLLKLEQQYCQIADRAERNTFLRELLDKQDNVKPNSIASLLARQGNDGQDHIFTPVTGKLPDDKPLSEADQKSIEKRSSKMREFLEKNKSSDAGMRM